MNTLKKLALAVALLCAVLFASTVVTPVVHAADAPVSAPANTPSVSSPAQVENTQPKVEAEKPAVTNQAAMDIVTWLTPLLVPLLVTGLKKLAPNVPGWVLPILAPVIGIVIDLVGRLSESHQGNLFAAAALGLAGVGLREVKDQIHTKIDPDRA